MTLLLTEPRETDGLLGVVERASGQNVYACYQCGKCMAACPFSLAPQQVLRLLQLDHVEGALAHATTWECASCMTCQTVCPKGVSPARLQRTLRTLHLHGRNGHDGDPAGPPVSDRPAREHAHRLRTMLFTNIHHLSRLGSALAPFSNWAVRNPIARLVNDKVLGIHKERTLPPFVRETFPAWFRKHTPKGDGRRGTVLLFHDTFMDHNYPSTGIALTELLETAGFRVQMADMVCCGRPMISKGQLDQAAKQAVTNVTKLYDQVRDGSWLVGCEPSCLLTLRDEYHDLVPAALKDKARVVGAQSLLVDEFLDMLNVKGDLGLTFRRPGDETRDVVFHGHCHQKAFAAPEKTVELLRLAGYDADMADAPCCGMAGSYGFEKEHYELSRAAGERALFPIVRSRPQAQVAVMGTSCRQQVEHFTGRRPRHVVELLKDALAPEEAHE
jgi:Fe-S oxidoreductase